MIFYNTPNALDDMEWETDSKQESMPTPPSSQPPRYDAVFDCPMSTTVSDAGYSSMSSEPFTPVRPSGLGLFVPSIEIDGYCYGDQQPWYAQQAQVNEAPTASLVAHGLPIIDPQCLMNNEALGNRHRDAVSTTCTPWNLIDPTPYGPSPALSPTCSNYTMMSYHTPMQSPLGFSESTGEVAPSPYIKIEPPIETMMISHDPRATVQQSPQSSSLGFDQYSPGKGRRRIGSLTPFDRPPTIARTGILRNLPAHSMQSRPSVEINLQANLRSGRKKRNYTTEENARQSCDVCGKLFQRKFNYRKHMETHQPHRVQPFTCEHGGCKKSFGRKTDLVRHQKSLHLKVRDHVCPLCGSTFTRKDICTRHMDDGCRLRLKVKPRSVVSSGDTNKPVKRRLRARLRG